MAGSPKRNPTREEPVIARAAFVSTYPPRHCGIASFTHDLSSATGDREIVALHPGDQPLPYGLEVHHRIRRDEQSDYAPIARSLSRCVEVASIQHEFGIWGGPNGAYVLDFVEALSVPAVTTLHTVLREPSPEQRAILSELIARSDATVVMSQSAARLLATAYGVDDRTLDVIPHGVPDLPLVDPTPVKAGLGVEGREVILTFGLLGPGKGLELALEALPAVVAEHPTACYVIVGATHPDLVRSEGEAYRQRLLAQVAAAGMEDHVRFVDRFVGRVELTRWLEAADVFVTPYPRLDQIVSGTLSYAMGAGRAIVSTPYSYAAEVLADGRGVLIPPASPAALAAALIEILGDDELRASLGRRAHAYSRRMVWWAVAGGYRAVFDRLAAKPAAVQPKRSLAVVGA
ncbi:MAG TPA: glycosyltransferase family 4 protein [Candidatus Limnocylindrales bacterium]|nr:glycosyltransferase family 4 protein [Candidatus Limnocylindrales bacterium]